MRYMKAQVQVPYFDEAGAKQWIVINIGSPIDRRRLLRGVRKFVRDNFKKRVSNDWVKMHCIITFPTEQLKGYTPDIMIVDEIVIESKEEQRKRMDDIYMMLVKDAEDADQDGTDTEAQESNTTQAGQSVQSVPKDS